MKWLLHRTSWPVRLFALGLLAVAIGWLMSKMPAETPGVRNWPWVVLGGALEAVTVIAFCLHRRTSSSGRVERWAAKNQRNGGVASSWEICCTASWIAMRRKARVLRPSLALRGFVGRLFVRTKEYATPLARVGIWRVWSAIEDVTVRVGGPRVGKTGELCGRILDAPGAVIATSTRTDLIDNTKRLRARKGPVHVFNPSGVGELPSTITFDPLSGCQDPRTAADRASDLLAGATAPGDGGDREFWSGQARRTLTWMLHAAALGGASMRDVQAWLANPDAAAGDVRRYLRRSPERAFEEVAAQFIGTNDKTRSSVCTTIMPALEWLTDATAAAAATGGDFDVAELLAQRGTVYMLGAEHVQVAPLVTALTGHIAREARRIAALQPKGRLDPPLTLALDEAALICPIPLENWTADMGGRGVTIHIAVQSRAQLRQRWGEAGAATILNNAATLLIFGGTKDNDDLAAYSTLTGERYEEVPTYDKDGNLTGTTNRRVPVLSAAQIQQLPADHVVIIRRGMPAAIGKTRPAWRWHKVRAADRAARRAEVFAELHAAGIRFRDWAWPRIATARAVATHKAGLAWAWAQPRLVELGVRLVERFMRTVERFDDASRNRRARRAAERAGRSDR